MEQIPENMQKYYNYKEQMSRLKKALKQGFYLEAIFIEYAVMEDRLESILRHSNRWHPKPGQFLSISQKLGQVSALIRQKKTISKKYFTQELLDDIRAWKNKRNPLIHALLKQDLREMDLQAIAEEGSALANTLCNKTTSYKRALEREEAKKQSSGT